MRWRHHEVPLPAWMEDWAARRLGPEAPAKRVKLAQEAWKEIGETVYSCQVPCSIMRANQARELLHCLHRLLARSYLQSLGRLVLGRYQTTQMGQVKSMMESRPRLDLYTGWIPNSDFMPIRRHYPESSLVNAWHKLMLATVPDGVDGFTPPAAAVFDVVDVTRQVLSDAFARLFVNLAGFVHVKIGQGDALPTGDIKTVTQAEERMQLLLGILTDVDSMLATQGHMLLGKVSL